MIERPFLQAILLGMGLAACSTQNISRTPSRVNPISPKLGIIDRCWTWLHPQKREIVLDPERTAFNRQLEATVSEASLSKSFAIYEKKELVLTFAELAYLLELQKAGRLPSLSYFVNRDQNLDFAFINDLPSDAQSILLRLLPFFQKNRLDWFAKLPEELRSSILEIFVVRATRKWDDEALDQSYLKAWKHFNALDPEQKESWVSQSREFTHAESSKSQWQKFYFVKLPVKSIANSSKISVKIGDGVFNGALSGKDEVVIEVPASRVLHPAWNPLSTEKLIGIANSFTARPADYPVSLELDGYFYLIDKNHRFEIFRRDFVKVRLVIHTDELGQKYLRTGNLDNFLIAQGFPETTGEVAQAVSRGQKTPFETLNEQMRRRLAWPESDLQVPPLKVEALSH